MMDSLADKIALAKADIARTEIRIAHTADKRVAEMLKVTVEYGKYMLAKFEKELAETDDEPLTAEERAEIAYAEEQRAKKEERRIVTKDGGKVYDTNCATCYMVTEEVGDGEERVIAYCASRNMARIIIKALNDFAGGVVQDGHEGAVHLYEKSDIIHRGFVSDGTYHEAAYQRIY